MSGAGLATEPLVSLILCVKDGMPFLPRALVSVALQTYSNIELVVQDACSSDGSLEAVVEAAQAGRLCDVDVVSEPDGGIGDAYRRALARCGGDIIGSIDADNMLDPRAVEVAVAALAARPDAAAVYGSVVQVDADDNVVGYWEPPAFDLVGVMACTVVPPFGQSFFSRAVCGADLSFEPSMQTCVDFDLWLRLGFHPVLTVPEPVGYVRTSAKSMTCNPARYERFCLDKVAALDRFLARHGTSALTAHLRERSVRGIHRWAADSVRALEGESERYRALAARAA